MRFRLPRPRVAPRVAVLALGAPALGVMLVLVHPGFATGTSQTGPLLVTITTSPNPYAIAGTSTVANSAGVYGAGESTGASIKGVEGIARTGGSVGVEGYSESTSSPANGVYGYSADGNGVYGNNAGRAYAAIYGLSTAVDGTAVYGNAAGTGVLGASSGGNGIRGSTTFVNTSKFEIIRAGVLGEDDSSAGENFGVQGISTNNYGVQGSSETESGIGGSTESDSTGGGIAGVIGYDLSEESATNSGVEGNSGGGTGVTGISSVGQGVFGSSGPPAAVAMPAQAGVVGSIAGYSGATPAPNINVEVGVAGISGLGSGVLGESTLGNAVVGQNTTSVSSTLAPNTYSNTGVFAASNIGSGVYAYSRNRNGAAIENDNAGFPTLNILADNTSTNPIEVYQSSTSTTPLMKLDSGGNLTLKGDVVDKNGTFARSSNPNSDLMTYAPQESEPTVEDFGTAQLVSGAAAVALAPDFRQTIDGQSTYMVFLTPHGDSNGLYVASTAAGGFIVRESHNGRSTFAFDYRVVARPYGVRQRRLPHYAAIAGHLAPPSAMSPGEFQRLTAPVRTTRTEALEAARYREAALLTSGNAAKLRMSTSVRTPDRLAPPFANRP
jgi:hypothetical protein